MKNKINFLRRLIIFYIVWPLAYRLGCLLPVNKKQAVFAYNKHYTSLPDNMVELKKIYEQAGWKCIEYGNEESAFQRLIGDIRFQFIYARSARIFITDNFDPLWANKPRKDTRVIQLWHACGAFKKWGYSTLDADWGGERRMWEIFPRYNTMTDVFVSAEHIIPCYAEAFNCKEEIIKPLGVPRTDVFFDESFVASGREKVVSAIPEIGERKIILYAPTFRGNSPTDAHNDDVIDFGKFKKAMGDEYVLILKYHPFTNGEDTFTEECKTLYGDSVFLCPKEIGIDTAMCAADILVSDYSSLVFEYSLLHRPMIFFAYDLEEYDTTRSYYYDYKTFVPGPIASTDDEVLDYILNGTDMSKVQAFREKFMSACDGNSTKRIAEYTIKN